MSATWEQADRLKAQIAADEAQMGALEAERSPLAVGYLLANVSAYMRHDPKCHCLTAEARATFRLTRKVECTCGYLDAMTRVLAWIALHAPDVHRQVTGLTPGDA